MIALSLLVGFAAGWAHFALLRWNTQLYLASGGSMLAVCAQLLRLASITLLLGFAAWNGALPLLFTAASVNLARLFVLRTNPLLP
jgi:hypothetical protein